MKTIFEKSNLEELSDVIIQLFHTTYLRIPFTALLNVEVTVFLFVAAHLIAEHVSSDNNVL